MSTRRTEPPLVPVALEAPRASTGKAGPFSRTSQPNTGAKLPGLESSLSAWQGKGRAAVG